MQYNSNGYIVSDISLANGWVEKCMKGEIYHGVHEYDTFPLIHYERDSICRKLYNEQAWRKINENAFQPLEFITDADLLKRYLDACHNKGIQCKVLFIESDYDVETTNSLPRKRNFLGYEVCEIPFDPWTLLDLFNREQFVDFKAKLNQNGLFTNEKIALAFREEYYKELHAGNVGDGEVDLYICKVFEVDITDLPFMK